MSEQTKTSVLQYRLDAVEQGLQHDFAFTPLRGKRPTQKGWTKAERATPQQALAWARVGNVGLRTGQPSGVVVVDIDEGADARSLELPPTVECLTGKNGRHLYYRAPSCQTKNGVSSLGQKIDFRGDGGQVVFPGSIHPDTQVMYRWREGHAPGEIPIAELPESILSVVAKRPAPSQTPSTQRVLQGSGSGNGEASPYGARALEEELEVVRRAPEGERNDTLNRASFNLGQLIASGDLPEHLVVDRLTAATGLEDAFEVRRTIRSGIESGMQHPRRWHREDGTASFNGRENSQQPQVLVPGEHLGDRKRTIEQSVSAFADSVLSALPAGVFYRLGGICGEIVGASGEMKFMPCSQNHARLKIDQHLRLVRGGSRARATRFVACRKDHAGLVLASASTHAAVRELRLMVQYPAWQCTPGWNESGVYFDQSPDICNIATIRDHHEVRQAFKDLLVDFPFADDASRQNAIGLLLTVLLRPTLGGNAPLHLVTSPMERTGKSKFVEEIVGGILLGRPIPALHFSANEEEQDKRIVSLLIQSATVFHIDNIRNHLDSTTLATLLTATRYQGRLLGESRMVELPNHTTIIATGNNISMTGEMAKRTVPIMLSPLDGSPELRTDFIHPDLRSYVATHRARLLGCLLGMIENWEEAGKPRGELPFGGFERWAAAVGGIMQLHGYDSWLGNRSSWLHESDPEGRDLTELVHAWDRKWGRKEVRAEEVQTLARDLDLFPTGGSRGESESSGGFARRVLSRHKNRPVGCYTIRQKRTKVGRRWCLEAVRAEGDER